MNHFKEKVKYNKRKNKYDLAHFEQNISTDKKHPLTRKEHFLKKNACILGI